MCIRDRIIGGGRPLLPEILGQSDRVGVKSPIFYLFSFVAPQPYDLGEKSSIYILKFVAAMFDRPSATTERRPLHIGRGAVLAVVITHGRRVKRYSGDISHKLVIALWLFTRRPAHTPPSAAAVPLAAKPTLDTAKVPLSLSLTSCTSSS